MQIAIENVHVHMHPQGGDVMVKAFLEALLRGPELSPDQETTQAAPEVAPAIITFPRIAELWEEHGGIYSGIARAEDGHPDGHLILLVEEPKTLLNWNDAKAYAESVGNGARLPTRFEAALLYANLRDHFNDDDWHWTGTQYSETRAWNQYFSYGDQHFSYKSSERRVRLVRRLAI